ncbi:MAG: cell division protein SepF [Oscillospiraceae bacterium]|nr:cell division protein SepF [Oscillospiraceae bacterium]
MALSDLFAKFRQNDEEFEEENYGGYDDSSSAVTEEEAEASSRYSAPRSSEKVINMHNSGYHGASVKVIQPLKYEDIMKEPVRFLRENTSVVLNLEKVASVDSRKRIVDFMAGVVAAIDGRIVRIAECTYFVVPRSVDLSGDMMETEQF